MPFRILPLLNPLLCCAILMLGAGQSQAQETEKYVPQFGGGTAGDLELGTQATILNTGAETATVSIFAFDENGASSELLTDSSAAATDIIFTSVGPNQTFNVASRGFGDLELGWLCILSSEPIEVETVFSIKKGGEEITRANVNARPITRAAFLANSFVTGGPDTNRQSGLALVNPEEGEGAMDAVITLTPIGGITGSPVSEPITITLKPGEKLVDFLDTLAVKQGIVLPAFFGWVSVEVIGAPVWAVALEQQGNGVLTSHALFDLP